jgi:predicted PurR-regulated permease PerM
MNADGAQPHGSTDLARVTLQLLVLGALILSTFWIRDADLPLLLIFTGVIGGLVAFGIIGLFVGPVVLVVAYTLLVDWVTGSEGYDEQGPPLRTR